MILQQLKADYKRIFSSPKMYLSILGVVLLCYISTEKYIHGSVDIYYLSLIHISEPTRRS